MGLEGVELVMELEESFDISFTDEEATSMLTMRDIHETVLSKLSSKPAPAICRSQIAFYRLRASLSKLTGRDKRTITRSARTADLLPIASRYRAWSELARSVDLRLPLLMRPSWLVLLLIIMFEIITFAAVPSVAATPLGQHPWLSFTAWLILYTSMAVYLTRPFARSIPKEIGTIGDFAKHLATRNFGKLSKANADPQEVWCAICHIFASQLDMKPEELFPDSYIPDLLGN